MPGAGEAPRTKVFNKRPVAHNGIDAKRYPLMEHHARWLMQYAGQNLRPIHKMPRNFFANYETWRKEAAHQEGKETPRQTNTNAEMSSFDYSSS